MQNFKQVLLPLSILFVLLVGGNTFFIITEGRQAIITQFGKPIGDPIVKAGLHMKMPFIQDVRYVDRRILSWDGHPNQVPTRDKKYIQVDTTARWQIVDALRFIQTVESERAAKARLDAILDSATRDVISNHNLVEAVRLSNDILDIIERRRDQIRGQSTEDGELDDSLIEAQIVEEITGDIERVEVGREELSAMIVRAAETSLREFGIKLIDVQLRRISYEESVERNVYQRMISERERIAEKIRSLGQAERARIEGRRERDLRRIQSEAYRQAQEIRGKADAEAASIYADAMGRDPSFFNFMRSMDAYKKAVSGDSKMIMSTDSEFLKFFERL